MLSVGALMGLLTTAVFTPFAWLIVEVLAALLPTRRLAESLDHRPPVAVLVPAHDEAAGIAETLAGICGHLRDHDRLVVVADNCTDATATIARSAGAEVIERSDSIHRGKGYALDFGIRHLASHPPEIVVVIDADTKVKPWTIDALAVEVARTGRPTQGVNLLDPPSDASAGARISSFAFFFKNYVRPRGMDRLGLPCLLYGTGMALPWSVLQTAQLAHGDITEDIRLSVDLALHGATTSFATNAHVRGVLPSGSAAAAAQRRRWEHGHLGTILRCVPRLMFAGILRRRFDLFGLAFHLGVPPLAFLFLINVSWLSILLVTRQNQLAVWHVCGIGAAGGAILASWFRFGRDRLPARDLLTFPWYVAKKIPLYIAFAFGRQRNWVRTDRPETPSS